MAAPEAMVTMDVAIADDPYSYRDLLRKLQKDGNKISMVQFMNNSWIITYTKVPPIQIVEEATH